MLRDWHGGSGRDELFPKDKRQSPLWVPVSPRCQEPPAQIPVPSAALIWTVVSRLPPWVPCASTLSGEGDAPSPAHLGSAWISMWSPFGWEEERSQVLTFNQFGDRCGKKAHDSPHRTTPLSQQPLTPTYLLMHVTLTVWKCSQAQMFGKAQCESRGMAPWSPNKRQIIDLCCGWHSQYRKYWH